MSLATRCPACGTIFRVVQDQLKVSEGWVRCGQCHEVFHGIEALFDLDSDPAIAARRAAARGSFAPPPTRVFAQQRANAPIPIPVPTPPAASPIAIPARAPAPMANTPAPQSVQASPSAFSTSDYPPAPPTTRPGYTGFTPAMHPFSPPAPPAVAPLPAASPTPFVPMATRSTIAPRFAARLAEESARAQASTSGSRPAITASAPMPFDGTPGQHAPGSAWQPPPPSEDDAMPAAFAPTAPISLDELVMPMAAAPISHAPGPLAPPPAPMFAETPLVTPLATPIPTPSAPTPAPAMAPIDTARSAADLASAFAADPPLDAPTATAAPASALAPVADVGGSVPFHELVDDDADDARAGPPTLASMLPEDAGDWPPRRTKKRVPDAAKSELEVVDRTKDPRFLREAKSGARWRRPWVRAVLGLALLLLIAGAAGQLAWPQRDMLASRFPATLPAWTWLCEQADCTIEAPRAIASLALDGSSLTRTDTEHVLLFSADLHNRADHAVRTPSFDVTFMDLNGEIVARKVLTPEEIGIHQAALPAEGELHVHARLQVGTLAASGFQADLFYP